MDGLLDLDALLDRADRLGGRSGGRGQLLGQLFTQAEDGRGEVAQVPQRRNVDRQPRLPKLAARAIPAAEREPGAEQVAGLGVYEAAAALLRVVAKVVRELVGRGLFHVDLDRRGVALVGQHDRPREDAEVEQPALEVGQLARIQGLAGLDVDLAADETLPSAVEAGDRDRADHHRLALRDLEGEREVRAGRVQPGDHAHRGMAEAQVEVAQALHGQGDRVGIVGPPRLDGGQLTQLLLGSGDALEAHLRDHRPRTLLDRHDDVHLSISLRDLGGSDVRGEVLLLLIGGLDAALSLLRVAHERGHPPGGLLER